MCLLMLVKRSQLSLVTVSSLYCLHTVVFCSMYLVTKPIFSFLESSNEILGRNPSEAPHSSNSNTEPGTDSKGYHTRGNIVA